VIPSPSTRFTAAIRTHHTVVTEVTVVDANGLTVATLEHDGGSVTVDGRQHIRRSCELSILDPTDELTPVTYSDLLAPYSGYELVVRRGIEFAPGDREYVTLGVFTLTGCKAKSDAAGTSLDVSGEDRASVVSEKFRTEPAVVDEGTNLVDAVQQIITAAWPTATFIANTSTDIESPYVVLDTDSDPWSDAEDVALVCAADVYINNVGAVVIADIPGFEQTPVDTFTHDETDVVTGFERDMSGSDVSNGVIVIGEGSELVAPVRGEAWDDDPASALYRLGPLGERPTEITSALVVSDEQAASVATAQLRRYLGQPITATMVPIILLEPGDVVLMRRLIRGQLREALVLIDSVQIPLSPGPMSIAGRSTTWI